MSSLETLTWVAVGAVALLTITQRKLAETRHTAIIVPVPQREIDPTRWRGNSQPTFARDGNRRPIQHYEVERLMDKV